MHLAAGGDLSAGERRVLRQLIALDAATKARLEERRTDRGAGATGTRVTPSGDRRGLWRGPLRIRVVAPREARRSA